MTKPSTIAVLNSMQNGVPIADTKIGGPNAPYRKTIPKIPKPATVMTESQLEKREQIRSYLQVGKWVIEFTKADGTNAIMECTLDPKLLPSSDPTVFAGAGRPEQPHLLHVYSTDRDGWRSFITNNMQRMYQLPEAL
jgi:hypothetical protein